MTAPDARLALEQWLQNQHDYHVGSFASGDPVMQRHIEFLKTSIELVRASQPGTVSREEAWCQPMDCGKHTPRRFMIYFDDPDHGIMVFDNEAEARAAFERKNTAWNCYLFGALPLSLSIPANGREALKAAEASFEFIRLKLIKHLEEPERSAFWTAVGARDAVRAALSALPVKEDALDSKGATSAAESICDWADNNLSMYEACTEENPVKARELFEAAKRLRDLLKNIPAVSGGSPLRPSRLGYRPVPWADGEVLERAHRPAPPSPDREAVWQPIETAPKDGTPFLCFHPDDVFSPQTGIDLVWYEPSIKTYTIDGDTRAPFSGITHWRPLPAPPSNAGEGGK